MARADVLTGEVATPPGDLPPVLRFEAVSKRFGGVTAVDGVTFEVERGDVHALVGENGAGKSTLIKVLAGAHRPDGGGVALDGHAVAFTRPGEALAAGIACVHQVPMFVASLSITENLFLGSAYPERRARLIDWPAEHARAAEALSGVRLDIDPRTRVDLLATHERQLVALARALWTEPRILVLDEITAPLAEVEARMLHAVVRELAQRGVAILYVSHRLDELFGLCDRVTVLRDGRHVATRDADELDVGVLTRLIVGADVHLFDRTGTPSATSAEHPEHDARQPALEVDGLSDGRGPGVSFAVARGEVLGLAGLAGSGRSRVLELLFGARRRAAGTVTLRGAPFEPRHPAEAVESGVALVTEDRQRDGYVPGMAVWKTISLPWVRRFRRGGTLALRRERATAAARAEELAVRMPSVDAPIDALSGGNQQKAIFARWIDEPLELLLLDEPTHGVDIRSKAEIYDIVRRLAERGVATIVASSELEELEALCDRVLLLDEGAIVGELRDADVTKEAMLTALLDPQQRRTEAP